MELNRRLFVFSFVFSVALLELEIIVIFVVIMFFAATFMASRVSIYCICFNVLKPFDTALS